MIAEPCHPRRLTGATTTLVGFSDNRLLSTTLDCTRPAAPIVTYSYRDTFQNLLRRSASFISPSVDPDEISEQLYSNLRAALDRVDPLDPPPLGYATVDCKLLGNEG